ncbi:MAG: chitobiase/beta-hexosaminidase C-terminal domain-containing protein [Flavobacteriales bacterium]|nr:chitobiase/beta-hexosaminidase C-terminal domain-containing protein [Flavobacteriales bacterium]
MKKIHNLLILTILTFSTIVSATEIHVKKANSSEAPRVHVWTYNSANDVPITNTSNWPNNLPYTTAESNGWFSYSFDSTAYGCLFVYNNGQTADFKYYTNDRWIILNEDGTLQSVNEVNPETANDIIFSESVAPKENGKYNEGAVVQITITNPGNKDIYYTTDGSDPSAVIGSINGTEYTEPIEIISNTTLKVSLAGAYAYGFPVLGTPVVKTYEFEEVVIIPSFTYSTNPGLSDNGTYLEGTTVEVTFNLSNPSNDPDWDIYYSLDGNDVDLSQINGGNYLNPIRYAGAFNITSDIVVYAKLFNVTTGQSQGVSPMVFNFEQPTPQQTIYVKKEGSLTPPKIHVWREDGAATITNPANWPNNLPLMTYDHESSDGWYSYAFDEVPSFGTLFYLDNFKTQDYKFYSEDRYFLFDENNNLISNTTTKPFDEEIILEASVDIEPNANGKYDYGTVITVTFSSNGGYSDRYIAYTTDGSDPATSSTFTQLNKTEGYPTTLQITSNTQLRAIEEQLYRSNPRSNEVSMNIEFEEPSSYLEYSTDIKPNENGSFTEGETVNVSISRLIGCGGCSFAVFYTTDGSEPSESETKTLYTDAIPVSQNTTIKAAINSYMGGTWYPTEEFTLTFEPPFEEVPSFTYSTTPGLSDNGTYPAGATVSTTFNLNYPSDNPNWIIYYALDGNPVDLANVGTGSQNAILYESAFDVTSNLVVYATMYNTYTGQSQSVSPMIFTFEVPVPQYKIYVKKQSGNTPPKIHVWSNPEENKPAMTDSSNWPTNLPEMTYTYDNGWYQFTTYDFDSYGTLFILDGEQTEDYKFYSEDRWFIFDENNELVSNTTTKPVTIELSLSNDIQPNADGKFVAGQTVTATFTSNGGSYQRYIRYTTDGSDPKTSASYQLIVITQYTPATLEITEDTALRAIEEGIYGAGPYSNEVSFNYEFEKGKLVTIERDIEPRSNGYYTSGQTVNVTISRTEGCGGCSYADYYTLDGSDPKTSETRIQGGAFVSLEITTATQLRAISYPVMSNPDDYEEAAETFLFEPEQSSTIFVKRIGHDYCPKFHVWTKESGADVAITNPSNWPNNLPDFYSHDGDGWYKYNLTNIEFGVLFVYADNYQTPDFKYFSDSVYIYLAQDGSTISVTNTKPSSSRESFEEAIPNNGLRLSPNPTSNTFTINFSNGKSESSIVTIYDLSGKLIYSETVPESSFINKEYSRFDLGLDSGTYIINVVSDSSNEIQRLVIK